MRLRRLLRPDSLAGRTVWLLVGGLSMLHVGSMFIHERSLHGAEVNALEARMSDRILAAGSIAAQAPPQEREAMVRNLSLPGLVLEWRAGMPLGLAEGAVFAPAELAARLGPQLRSLRSGTESQGAVQAPWGGWVQFVATRPPVHRFPSLPADWISMGAMALGILLASIPIIGWMTEPLRRLAEAADKVGRDPRPATLSTDGPTEVRHAAQAFNAMQARIVRLIEDRTEALAALSHDFRTPLARLRLRAGFLPEGEERARIETDVAEMEMMVAGVLAYFREGRDAEPAVSTDLAAILQTLADEAADSGQDVSYAGPGHFVLPLRRLAAKRAVQNLVVNALHHGAPPVTIRLLTDANGVVLEVADAGPGIAPADRERALTPFVRLDPARGGGGVGLGLTTAARFAAAEGGSLELDGHAGGGLQVRIRLPGR